MSAGSILILNIYKKGAVKMLQHKVFATANVYYCYLSYFYNSDYLCCTEISSC